MHLTQKLSSPQSFPAPPGTNKESVLNERAGVAPTVQEALLDLTAVLTDT